MAITDSLISFWKLDETSGAALDAHGPNGLTETGTAPAATGLVYPTARDLERGDNDYFQVADSAGLSSGDVDFTVAVWVKAESFGSAGDNLYIVSKSDGDLEDEYRLLYRGFGGTNRFRFSIIHTGGTGEVSVDANSLGLPGTGTWYLIVCWHDATADTVNIQVNGGTVDSTATAGMAPTDGAGKFLLGAYVLAAPLSWDGLIGPAMFWKRVLTADERTWLYNGGAGRTYESFAPVALEDDGLQFWTVTRW